MNRHIFVFAYWEPRHSEGVLYDMEVKRNACHHPPGAGICSARSPSFIATRASPPHKFPLPRNQAQFHTKRLGKHANFRLYRARTPFCMLITFRHTRCSKNSTRRRLKAKTCVNVTLRVKQTHQTFEIIHSQVLIYVCGYLIVKEIKSWLAFHFS